MEQQTAGSLVGPEFEIVIGLEVHVQLSTRSKLFTACATSFGEEPNHRVCVVSLGLPGSLPVLNREALHSSLKVALALNCKIGSFIKFDRKHYFYPDLPKGYQISQYDQPLAQHGWVEISAGEGRRRIGVTRVHMEEDAGKLVHSEKGKGSLVDYNRAGTPLIEIVSEPDMRSPEEAYAYLQALKSIVSYLNVSDCNMEEGSLRCDANISLRPRGSETLGTKTEIKNLNSFKGVRASLEYEAQRQAQALRSGQLIIQETLLWDADRNVTRTMRTKEEAHDYRYMPDPDLPPVILENSYIEETRQTLPELPYDRRERFVRDYQLNDYDAGVLTQERQLADYFEETVKIFAQPKKVCNWVSTEMLGLLNFKHLELSEFKVSPAQLGRLLQMWEDGSVNGKVAKEVYAQMVEKGGDPDRIVEEKGLSQVSDQSALEEAVAKAIEENPKAVEDFKSGNKKAAGFFVGQVMKMTQGRGNPQIITQILKNKLDG
ncbi:MAG: Asp-tRNA(Asn)/Glu-tRNA(Gln) amidotransferase subunit GatB [Candidatus Omnitrophica bacterium]|nr:Asp-tRNA(Asn)/Glu-tRNA(Gln) amidotransferase subunit GatB [Candidatus Omnitrophota bacterium]